MINFKNKKIAVIGDGVEGQSSAKYLKKHGADVTVLDKKDGEDYLKNLNEYDLIVRSPGVNPDLLKDVPQQKITSQTRLFLDLTPAKVIGVTGTKGKGTTSSLIHEILRKQGFDAYLGGNIGKPPFEFLDNLNTHSIVVLEMSSFQLIDIQKSPNIVVILMITSEHLNWHKDLKEYVSAKRNILKFQTEKDFAVINKDYPESRESDIDVNGNIYYVSREEECARGCYIRDGWVWIADGQEELQRVVSTSEILLPGQHNWENVCAASMVAYLAGVSIPNIAYVLKSFKGLEHRLELVETINGVKYYNDSFSTTPESAIAAVEAFKNPEILILGGSHKGSDFAELGRIISEAQNIKAIIGIGKEWPVIKSKIKDKISRPQTPERSDGGQANLSQILFIEGADSMEKIVAAASKIVVDGDVVILSPACASFDMFKNYKDRGDQFKSEVLKLKTS